MASELERLELSFDLSSLHDPPAGVVKDAGVVEEDSDEDKTEPEPDARPASPTPPPSPNLSPRIAADVPQEPEVPAIPQLDLGWVRGALTSSVLRDRPLLASVSRVLDDREFTIAPHNTIPVPGRRYRLTVLAIMDSTTGIGDEVELLLFRHGKGGGAGNRFSFLRLGDLDVSGGIFVLPNSSKETADAALEKFRIMDVESVQKKGKKRPAPACGKENEGDDHDKDGRGKQQVAKAAAKQLQLVKQRAKEQAAKLRQQKAAEKKRRQRAAKKKKELEAAEHAKVADEEEWLRSKRAKLDEKKARLEQQGVELDAALEEQAAATKAAKEAAKKAQQRAEAEEVTNHFQLQPFVRSGAEPLVYPQQLLAERYDQMMFNHLQSLMGARPYGASPRGSLLFR